MHAADVLAAATAPYLPNPQARQTPAPTEKAPAAHPVHTEGVVAVGTLLYRPGAHPVHTADVGAATTVP